MGRQSSRTRIPQLAAVDEGRGVQAAGDLA
jgi:hypothetical protein